MPEVSCSVVFPDKHLLMPTFSYPYQSKRGPMIAILLHIINGLATMTMWCGGEVKNGSDGFAVGHNNIYKLLL